MSTTPSASQSRITTLAELDRAADGTVILDRLGTVLQRSEDAFGQSYDWRFMGGARSLAKAIPLPATVLHDPAAPPVSDTTAATITPEQWSAARAVISDAVALAPERASRSTRVWAVNTATDAVLAALGLTVTDKADQ